jgi:glycosyltransferase involved in cell wall biosynthesis
MDRKKLSKNPTRRVLYFQYTNPAGYPSLEHSSRILASNGWEVLFLGTGAYGADVLKFPPHERITVRRMVFVPGGWRQKLHYVRFALWVFVSALRWRPKWVYASDPLSTPVALLLKSLLRLRVIYHEHDSPPSHDPTTRKRLTPFMRLVLTCRRHLGRRAELCVLPNEQRTRRFAAEITSQPNGPITADRVTNKPMTNNPRPKVLCVWNCPALEEVVHPLAEHRNDSVYLWYHGSIVPSQLPPAVIHALTKLPESLRLRVAGYETVGHVGYVEALRKLSQKLGVSERVEFLGAMPRRAELLQQCCNADIGLALFTKPTREPMVGASNKPFDYLACGLALLVSDLPDWRKIFVESGYGLACDTDDPGSIATALRWFLDHPEERRAMGERGRQRILAEWNYERQFAPVLERLDAGTH